MKRCDEAFNASSHRFIVSVAQICPKVQYGHKKKAPWRKNCPVFQQFLSVLYSVAFDI
jgi:hypothetical protein